MLSRICIQKLGMVKQPPTFPQGQKLNPRTVLHEVSIFKSCDSLNRKQIIACVCLEIYILYSLQDMYLLWKYMFIVNHFIIVYNKDCMCFGGRYLL